MYDPASLAAEGFRRMVFDAVTGREVWVRIEGTRMTVREFAPVDDLVVINHEQRAATAGTRYGDIAPIARVPMHLFTNRLAEPLRQGDKAHLDRVLNSAEFAPFRLRDGRI